MSNNDNHAREESPARQPKAQEKGSNAKKKLQLEIGARPQLIQNLDLQSCHEDNVLCSNGKRNLVVMNLHSQTIKSSALDDERIISAVFHPLLDVYIIVTDKQVISVNCEGETIFRQKIAELQGAKNIVLVAMQDGYEAVPAANTRRDLLLYTTSEYMYRVPLELKYERSLISKNPKSLCSLNISFVSEPEIILYEWLPSLKHLSRNGLLVCWNPNQTYIYRLPHSYKHTQQLLYTYDNISKKSSKVYDSSQNNRVTSYEASLKHRMLMASFMLGSIKVYRLDDSKKYVCELRGHQRQCSSLYISNQNDNLLYSTGLDNTIRVWDLVDLIQVYQVRVDIICGRLELLSEKTAFARSYDKKKTYLIKLVMHLLQPVLLSEEKSNTKVVNLSCDGEWGIALYSNNLVEAFLLNEKGEKSREFNEKIEFPIKYGFLRSAVKLENEKYAICMEKGFSILKLNKKEADNQNFYLKRLVYHHSLTAEGSNKGKFIEIIHEKLLGTYFFTILKDWKAIPFAITVTSVSLLLQQALSKWDVGFEARAIKSKQDYAILGTDRGYIYFIDIKDKDSYYTRVHYHSSPVLSVERIGGDSNRDLYFLSTTVRGECAIWAISRHEGAQPPRLLMSACYTLDISIMKVFSNYLVIGCREGQLNVYKISFIQKGESDDGIICEQDSQNREQGHLKAVTCLDYIKINVGTHEEDLFISGGEDRAIKIWQGLKKQLIFWMKIFNHINQLTFLHQGLDFMMSHGSSCQISLVRSKNIKELHESLQMLEKRNQEGQDANEDEVSAVNLKQVLCSKKKIEYEPLRKDRELELPHLESEIIMQHHQHQHHQPDIGQTSPPGLIQTNGISRKKTTSIRRQGKKVSQSSEVSNSLFLPRITPYLQHRSPPKNERWQKAKIKHSRGHSYSQIQNL